MTNILPQQAGLEVTGLFYQYSTIKDTDSDMVVFVQNENAIDGGYIYQSIDDWSGLPQNTIRKYNPLADIPIEYWGDGSIEVQGNGEVTDATVIYNYRFDPCFDPQSDPECPGYEWPIDLTPEDVVVEDPLEDPFIKDEMDRKAKLEDEDEKDRDRRRAIAEKKTKSELERSLSIADNELNNAEAQALHQALLLTGAIPSSYTAITLSGGTYPESVVLDGGNITDNRSGRRDSLRQQVLHEQMIRQQYER